MPATSIDFSRLKEIFLAARDLGDPAQRAAYLGEICGEDTTLRGRVERMLAADQVEDAFLEPAESAAGAEVPLRSGDTVGYFGDYVLLDEIARGASGVVFRARQVSLGRTVALKMLRDRPELATTAEADRLRAEAAATAALDHANIVPIYEIGVHAGQPFLSMKFVAGGTLQFRMAEFHADTRRAVQLLAKVARAVHHAHCHGILHRDLKPGNILLDEEGEPHVTDFGLARRLDAPSHLTLTGQIVGTPHYMAPEQATGGGRDLTPGADIYALGAVLYEMLSGRKVFAGDDVIALLLQVTETEPAPLPMVDRNLAAVVMKCLRKQPVQRYGTAEELAEELESWLATGQVRVHPEGVVHLMWRWLRRRWAWVAVFLMLAWGAWLWRTRSVPPAGVPAVAGQKDLERASAEWFLDHGGTLIYWPLGQGRVAIDYRAQLPKGAVSLEEVELDGFNKKKLPPPTPGDWRELHGSATLRRLLLRYTTITDESLTFLRHCPKLHRLELLGLRDLTDAALPHLDSLALTQLMVEGTQITPEALSRMPAAGRIRTLGFGYTDNLTDETVAALAAFTAVDRLEIVATPRLTDAGLARLASLPSLRRLTLSANQQVTGTGLSGWPASSKLDALICHRTTFNDAGCAAVARTVPGLRSLVVNHTKVTGVGLSHLAGLSRLENLEICHLPVADAALVPLYALKSLKSLSVTGTQVTDAGVAAFRAAVPGCAVVR